MKNWGVRTMAGVAHRGVNKLLFIVFSDIFTWCDITYDKFIARLRKMYNARKMVIARDVNER